MVSRRFSFWLETLLFLFFLPLFFQLQGNLYTDQSNLIEAGWLTKLPFPLSFAVAPIFLLILVWRKQISAFQWKLFIFWSLSLVIPLCLSFNMFKLKIVLIMILLFANFITGYSLYRHYHEVLAKRWILYGLILFMAIHLIYSIHVMRVLFLSPHFFHLMIYDHLQYVGLPLGLICAHSLLSNRDYFFRHLDILLPIITVLACYSIASLSLIVQVTFCCFFIAFCFLNKSVVPKLRLLVFGFGVLVYGSYFYAAKTMFNSHHAFAKFSLINHKIYNYQVNELDRDVYQANSVESALLLHGAIHRKIVWHECLKKIFDRPYEMLFGDREPLFSRREFSAHNFYLDFWYNFGIFPIIFLIALVGMTLFEIGRNINLAGWGSFVDQTNLAYGIPFIFFVLLDNNFKIAMRIPYSGAVTFLLWGVLMARLRSLPCNVDAAR